MSIKIEASNMTSVETRDPIMPDIRKETASGPVGLSPNTTTLVVDIHFRRQKNHGNDTTDAQPE